MVTYLSIALVATVLSMLGSHFATRSKVAQFIFLLASALVFCYFAGARSINVGTDTSVYGLSSYHVARQTSFSDFYFNSIYQSWGPLYKIMCWTSSCIGGNLFWYLFSIQALTVLPVYLALYRDLREHLSLGVFVYGLIFYPMSFNLMRQMIAMSFLLLAYRSADSRKPLHFIVWVVIASLFHSSAVLGLCIYPLVVYCMAPGKVLGRGLRSALIVILCAMVVSLAPQIFQLTDSIGLYSNYTSGAAHVAGGGMRTILATYGVFGALLFLGAVLSKKGNSPKGFARNGLFVVLSFGLICLPLSLISFYLYRISFYFLYFAILAFPNCMYSIDETKSKLLFVLVLFALLSFWFYDYYVFQVNNEVVPYSFQTYLY